MDYIKIAQDVLKLEAQELVNVSNNIDTNFADAIELINNKNGKLIVIGVGKSGLVGAKIAATLSSTGTSSFFLHPTESMHGDLGMVDKNDVILAISYSGESDELVQILPHIKRIGAPIVSMSKNPQSTLGKYSDIHLSIKINEEACPLNTAPTSSTTATMAMGDALAVCLMRKNDFQKEDFASFHPGGSLGKMLFVKVKDLIQTQNLPLVQKDTKIKDAIIVMNEGRIGNAIVVDDDKKIIGLLSDGDLRRALLKPNFSLENTVDKIATQNPKSIDDVNMLASQALALIEKHKIQLLTITNKNNELQGVLHIHSLVEAGIK